MRRIMRRIITALALVGAGACGGDSSPKASDYAGVPMVRNVDVYLDDIRIGRSDGGNDGPTFGAMGADAGKATTPGPHDSGQERDGSESSRSDAGPVDSSGFDAAMDSSMMADASAAADADAEVTTCDGGLCWCDLSGWWAVRHDVTLTLPKQEIGGTTFVAESVTTATLWELHRYDYNGTVIKVQKKGCGSDIYPKAVSPAYNEAYSSGVPQSVFDDLDLQDGVDIPLAAKDALPDKDFNTPKEAALVGIELDDPLNDEWPMTREDVPEDAWVDVDGDGVPGLTVWSADPNCPATDRGPAEDTICFTPIELEMDSTAVRRRASCVSVASRVVTHLEGKIEACGRLTGKVLNDKTEGRVYSCIQVADSKWNEPQSCTAADWANDDANKPCTVEQKDFLDQQDQSQKSEGTFVMVRLADISVSTVDCDEVRSALP